MNTVMEYFNGIRHATMRSVTGVIRRTSHCTVTRQNSMPIRCFQSHQELPVSYTEADVIGHAEGHEEERVTVRSQLYVASRQSAVSRHAVTAAGRCRIGRQPRY